MLDPVLFSIFLDDLDNGVECTLSKFTDDTKVGGGADTPGDHAAIQSDLNRLEKWTDRNLTQFSKRKCKVLHLGKNNPRHQYKLENSFAEKDLGVQVDTKLNMKQQCALDTKKAKDVLGCIQRSIASMLNEIIFPLYSVPIPGVLCPVLGSPV